MTCVTKYVDRILNVASYAARPDRLVVKNNDVDGNPL
jgi:hypothetical protein